MKHDKKSFLAGIAVGRSLSGWSTAASGGSGSTPVEDPRVPNVVALRAAATNFLTAYAPSRKVYGDCLAASTGNELVTVADGFASY